MTARSETVRTGLPVLVAEISLAPQPPALFVFGRDGRGKLRAAWFDVADCEAATAAAAAMQLRILRLTDDIGRDVAGRLARGRVLPSGSVVVPFTKRELYTRLVSLAGEGVELTVTAGGQSDPPSDGPAALDPPTERQDPTVAGSGVLESKGNERPSGVGNAARNVAGAPADAPPAPRPGAHLFVGQPRPGDRSEIGLGSIVLAHEGPDDGWWEAEVIGINGRTFSLRWRDYDPAAFPTILRTAEELALLPPGAP